MSPGEGWEGSHVEGLVEAVVGGVLVVVMVDAALSLCPIHILSSPDSKLQEELQALKETFSNFTVNMEAEVKGLRAQGEGALG